MKATVILTVFLLLAVHRVNTQAPPAATSGNANLIYSLRYAHSAEFGGSLGNWQTILPSGSVSYASGSDRHPFDLNYTLGYMEMLRGKSYYGASTGFFQHFAISQAFTGRGWNANVGDSVSYRPQSPITGFSGIPGIGEPIGGSGSNPSSSQTVVMLDTHALNNNVQAQYERILNHSISFNVGGGYDVLLFPDGNAIDTRSLDTTAGAHFRLNARNSFTTEYVFSRFTYPGYNYDFRSDAAMFGYDRIWSRSLKSTASVGPEWFRSSFINLSPTSVVQPVPTSTMVSARAELNYDTRFGSATVEYHRGTTGGGGYMAGGQTNQFSASMSRQFDRKLTLETVGGYRSTSSLASRSHISGEFGGFQSSWQVARHLSAYGNYTATSQSSNSYGRTNVLNELLQVLSFGIAYSRETNPAH